MKNKVKLAIFGAGGHGKICGAIAEELGYEFLFFDDSYPALNQCGQWPVIGGKQELLDSKNSFDFAFLAIGNCNVRAKMQKSLEESGLIFCNLIAKGAQVHSSVALGKGILVVGNACINIDARIDDGVIVNTNATVDHDCILEEYSHICPGVNLAGEVIVGARAWVGIGSSIIQKIHIGEAATIGAGSVVIRHVQENTKVAGSPAQILNGL
ncbi:acetyltransferase [Thalassotalea aquiviva]|uniref:acetyltransferase n=1 Tax=Thalassotalea aquiviva TaxID=3242415 RepID=UPI00352AC4D0